MCAMVPTDAALGPVGRLKEVINEASGLLAHQELAAGQALARSGKRSSVLIVSDHARGDHDTFDMRMVIRPQASPGTALAGTEVIARLVVRGTTGTVRYGRLGPDGQVCFREMVAGSFWRFELQAAPWLSAPMSVQTWEEMHDLLLITVATATAKPVVAAAATPARSSRPVACYRSAEGALETTIRTAQGGRLEAVMQGPQGDESFNNATVAFRVGQEGEGREPALRSATLKWSTIANCCMARVPLGRGSPTRTFLALPERAIQVSEQQDDDAGESSLPTPVPFAMDTVAMAASLADLEEELEVRRAAARALGRDGGPGARQALLDAINDYEPEVRKAVIGALGAMAANGLDSKRIVTTLLDCLDDDDLSIRLTAVPALVASVSALSSTELAGPIHQSE